MASAGDAAPPGVDVPSREVAALLHRALHEHDRLLKSQKTLFDKTLTEERAKHERDLAVLRAEIASLKALPSGQQKISLHDSDPQLVPPLALTSPKGDDAELLSDNRTSGCDSRPPQESQTEASKSPTRKTFAHKSLSRLTTRNLEGPKSRLRHFVDGPLDYVVCAVIALNTAFLFMQLQFNGQLIGVEEGLTTGDHMSDGAQQALFITEVSFNLFFLVELLTRMIVQRQNFLYHELHGEIEYFNIFDTFIVLGTTIDLLVQLQDTDAGLMNFSIFRPLRFLRLIRILRMVSSLRILLKLRVLLSTVACSLLALFWSIVLLFFTLLIASLFMNQALSGALGDESLGLETRQWLFRMYGTSTRSFYTVFELTFSGGWPQYARPLVEDVSPWWSLFFFFYIVIVTFAMFRIITALFLRDTLALAANDAETAIHEKLHMQRGIADKLMAFFEQADTSGDGMLTSEEFEAMLDDPMVAAWLSLLELEVREAIEVFNLVKHDHDMVSASEFVSGMTRIKGNARSQDVFAILQNGKKANKDMANLSASIMNIERSIQSLSHVEDVNV